MKISNSVFVSIIFHLILHSAIHVNAAKRGSCEDSITKPIAIPIVGVYVPGYSSQDTKVYILGEGGFAKVFRVEQSSKKQSSYVEKVYIRVATEDYEGFSMSQVVQAEALQLNYASTIFKEADISIFTPDIIEVKTSNSFNLKIERGQPGEGMLAPALKISDIKGSSLYDLIISSNKVSLSAAELLKKYNALVRKLYKYLKNSMNDKILQVYLEEDVINRKKVLSLHIDLITPEDNSGLLKKMALSITVSNIIVTPKRNFYLVDPL